MRPPAIAIAVLLALGLPAAPAAEDGWRDRLRESLRGGDSRRLSESDARGGLKEALAQGVQRAVLQLGREDGFWGDEALRIRLPGALEEAGRLARQLGRGERVDAFELSMNRAAEKAVPVAADVFAEAVRQMTVQDAVAIVRGDEDAGTRYFRRVTEDRLRAQFLPIVADSTAQVGVTGRYKAFAGRNAGVLRLLGRDGEVDLDRYVTDRALDALFAVVAEQEREIRRNPAARGSALLRKVFGGR